MEAFLGDIFSGINSDTSTWVAFAAIFFAAWLSEDGALLAAALLWKHGYVKLSTVYWANVCGISGIDLMLYAFAYHYGDAITRLPLIKRMAKPQRMERARRLHRRVGNWITFIVRFVPFTRVPGYLAAGLFKARPLPTVLIIISTGLAWIGLQLFLIAKAAEWLGPWLAVGAMALAIFGLSFIGRRLIAEQAPPPRMRRVLARSRKARIKKARFA